MLQTSGLGIGSIALTSLLDLDSVLAGESPSDYPNNLKPRRPHFEPQVRAVIMMMQNGGPSQMDLFDEKPELKKRDGQRHSDAVEQFQTGSEANKLMGSPFEFKRYGRSGMNLSEVIPHIGSVADDLCLVRSMVSEHNNHTEALVLLNTGKIFPGRPAIGSWVSYGLGTENANLPAYIVLRDPEGYNTSGTLLWQNGWLPAVFGGTEVSTKGAPILNLRPPEARLAAVERTNQDLLGKLNLAHQKNHAGEADLEARILNYELAARMQLAAPELLDISGESPATRKLYGLENETTAGYGLRCLMARRLVEAGVRFVQVFPPVKPQSQPWDSHGNVKDELTKICASCDEPTAALLRDLKGRGLLDSTLVIWSGEFGRLPISQNGKGRDHNRNAFSLLLAGGGFKPGHVHGATDPLGYRSVEDVVTVPDLHATILHQLGIDHTHLKFRLHGTNETPTDARVTKARVVRELLC
jgi:hypothetical protein